MGNHRSKMIKTVCSLLAICMFFSSALSFDFLAKAVNNSETVSGLKKEYIIKVRSFNDAKKVASDLSIDSRISEYDKTMVVTSLSEKQVSSLSRRTDVVLIEENYELTANTENIEPLGNDFTPWNLSAVNADEAHAAGETGSGVKIAVLDSGLDTYGEVMAYGGIDLVDSEESYGDDITGHGTSVAGIIAAPIDGSGIVGVSPGAEIYNVRVLDNGNTGTISRIVDGIDWCIENGMDIINMSFGTENYSQILDEKITEAAQAGIIMVSSAGNGSTIQYPAKFSSVIAVGSVNSSMEKSSASATGQELEFVAPGENVFSTMLIGGYSAMSGTSIAAPHVTGAAAVLLAKDPSQSPEFIRALLASSAKNLGNNTYFGNGIIDIAYALEIYDDFSDNYYSSSYTPPVNTGNVETFEDEDVFVEGLWSTEGHNDLIQGSYDLKSYNIRFPYYVKAVSLYCDKEQPTVNALHGNSNYIVAAKLLYEIAANYKVGTPGFSYLNYRYDLRDVLGPSFYDSLISAIGNALNYYRSDSIYVALDQDLNYFPKPFPAGITNFVSVSQKRSTIVFGMLFHLLGDIYAHRTVVPPSSLSVLNADYHDGTGSIHNQGLYFVESDFTPDCGNHIGNSQFNLDYDLALLAKNVPHNATNHLICNNQESCYGAMKRIAGLGILQFKDIKYFLSGFDLKTDDYKDNQRYYEDRPGYIGPNSNNGFYARRYKLARDVTKHYFNNFYDCIYVPGTPRDDDIVPFLPYYMLPVYSDIHSFKIKIDQFYNYILDFHSSSSILCQSTWSNNNDSLFYYTTIIYNNSYYIDPATYPDDDPSTAAVNDGKPVYYPNQVFCNGTPVALNSFYTS